MPLAPLEDQDAVTIPDSYRDDEQRWITLDQDAQGVSWSSLVRWPGEKARLIPRQLLGEGHTG